MMTSCAICMRSLCQCAHGYMASARQNTVRKRRCGPSMSDFPIFTYHTRVLLDADQTRLPDAYAELHGRAERVLFAAWCAGQIPAKLKPEFQRRFDLTARQFNAVRVGLEGKIHSIKERRPELIAEAAIRLKKAEKTVAMIEKRAPGSNKLHQKKRRVQTLRS